MRNQILSVAGAFLLSVAIFSCADSGTSNATNADSTAAMDNTSTSAAAGEMGTTGEQNAISPSKNVVENAVASPDHTTLVAAVKAAGLDGTLSGTGPFTVFAPTDAAFNKLPAGTVDNLVKPENKDQLTKILTYHVVSGSVMSSDLKDGQKVKTLQGEELTVRISDGKVMINDAVVSTPDVKSSNGVIHVVDGVLMPKK